MSKFILALQPHQRPGDAYAYESEQELVDDWVNGYFKKWFADNSHEIEGERSFEDAIDDIKHDLYGITLIYSQEDCDEWLNGKWLKVHNFPVKAVREQAERLGWSKQVYDAEWDEDEGKYFCADLTATSPDGNEWTDHDGLPASGSKFDRAEIHFVGGPRDGETVE